MTATSSARIKKQLGGKISCDCEPPTPIYSFLVAAAATLAPLLLSWGFSDLEEGRRISKDVSRIIVWIKVIVRQELYLV